MLDVMMGGNLTNPRPLVVPGAITDPAESQVLIKIYQSHTKGVKTQGKIRSKTGFVQCTGRHIFELYPILLPMNIVFQISVHKLLASNS